MDVRNLLAGKSPRPVLACVAVGLTLGAASSALAVESTFDNATMDEVVTYAQSYLDADDDSLMGIHKAAGLTCVSCHATDEDADPGAANPSGKRATCLVCHSDWEAIEDATSGWVGKVTVYNPTGIYNPHSNHRGDADCGDCHAMHSEQVLTCAQCHDITVPDGWLGYF